MAAPLTFQPRNDKDFFMASTPDEKLARSQQDCVDALDRVRALRSRVLQKLANADS